MKRAKIAIKTWLDLSKLKANSEQGFTLIEVMITGVIVAIMMIAFSGYMFQQAKQTQSQQTSQNYSQLKSNVLGNSSQAESVSASEGLDFTTFH